MLRIVFSLLLLSAISACSEEPTEAATAAATASATGICANPESGLIRGESPGLTEIKLEGPFLVTALQTITDPFNPRGSFVFWSNGNAAFNVENFKGPFYIADGESIFGNKDVSPLGVLYSGCRPD